MTNLKDETLVKQIKKGETEKFRVIVEKYQNKIYSISKRFLKNDEDALDLTQDIFLKIFQGLKSFKGKSSFKFWMTKIAFNEALRKSKSNKKREISLEEKKIDSFSGNQKTEKEVFNTLLREKLLKAINILPEKYRVCIDFFFFFDFSHKEISKLTGFPVNTVKSNVRRAKNILRNELYKEKDFFDEV